MKTLTQISIILLFVLVGATGTYMYNELSTPVYQAKTEIKIETLFPENSVVQKYNNFHMDLARTQDHTQAIISENVLLEVMKDAGNSFVDLTLQDIQKITMTKLNPKTLEISLKVSHQNPATAVLIANTIPVVYEKYFLDPDASVKTRVTITAPAQTPLEIASPKAPLNLSIACAVSLILGLVFSIFWQKSQQKISTEEDVQNNFNLPVLGAIPKPR
jgi:capsular polysaccharide biosynthesis protein